MAERDLVRGKALTIEVAGQPVTIRPTTFYKVSLQTTDEREAKRRFNQVQDALASAIAALGVAPMRLSRKQVAALAGEVYGSFIRHNEEDPGNPVMWVHVLKTFIDADLGEDGEGVLLIGDEARRDAAQESRFGAIADAILARKHLTVTPETRKLLIQDLNRVLVEAADRLAMNARGEYPVDAFAPTLPQWVPPKPEAAQPSKPEAMPQVVLSFADLFARYEKTPSTFQRRERTLRTYRRIVVEEFPKFLKSHAGHEDAAKVSKADVLAWRDALLSDGIQPKTVKAKKLAALGAAYRAGAEALMVEANPVQGAAPRVPRAVRERERGFTEEEAKAILRAVRDFEPSPRHRPETVAAFRWLPWIGAYTGARTVEIAQLRKEDFREGREGLVMRFTPEAGEVKTDGYRDIPVHQHLVALGLMDFVNGAGQGPLFYRPDKPGVVSASKARSVATRFAEWVREAAGVTDQRVQPNYGWRHWFKTEARRVGMDREASEWIMGHIIPGMAGEYGDMAGLRREIEKLPPIDLG